MLCGDLIVEKYVGTVKRSVELGGKALSINILSIAVKQNNLCFIFIGRVMEQLPMYPVTDKKDKMIMG